jgi:A/G-specific adenine glycosylase
MDQSGDAVRVKAIRKLLLRWFRKSGRSFPWRLHRDPYAILIAEKLLQQTAARPGVVDAYSELLARYPSIKSLARADIRTLNRIVRPLGLGYRAKELRQIARTLVSLFGGAVPSEISELMLLPGVGEYAARAVSCFAFGQHVAIVDINVARFLYRVFDISEPFPANPARKRSLIEMATNLLPKGHAREFNLAILDLCAAVCRPTRPHCEICIIRKYCGYGSRQTTKTAGRSLPGSPSIPNGLILPSAA